MRVRELPNRFPYAVKILWQRQNDEFDDKETDYGFIVVRDSTVPPEFKVEPDPRFWDDMGADLTPALPLYESLLSFFQAELAMQKLS